MFLRQALAGGKELTRWFSTGFQAVAEGCGWRLAFPMLTAPASKSQQLVITPEMRRNDLHACGLSARGSFLRNQQTLGIEIAKIQHGAQAAECGEYFAQGKDAVHKSVATHVHNGTKQFSFGIPSAGGMPCRGVFNHQHRPFWFWTRRPREWFGDDEATKRFRRESALTKQCGTARQLIESFLVNKDFK
jgi:hypothetical protein